MRKILLSIISLFILSTPVVLAVETEEFAVSRSTMAESLNDESVHIAIAGKKLRVQNAAGSVLMVYSVTGARVLVLRVDAQDQCFDLNLNKGCYIIKVGKVVRKVSINN